MARHEVSVGRVEERIGVVFEELLYSYSPRGVISEISEWRIGFLVIS